MKNSNTNQQEWQNNQERSDQEEEDQNSLYYKNSQKISYKEFKNLFKFEENDKEKKELKKEYKKLEKKHNGKVKFKHLIDFYLTSSEVFAESLDNIDTGKILDGLESKEEGFNQRLLKLICINSAVQKVQKELSTLEDIRDQLILVMQENKTSDKLQQFLDKLKDPNVNENQEFDKNIQQIDLKLSNMMQFMNDFALNFQTNMRESQFRPSSQGQVRPGSSGFTRGTVGGSSTSNQLTGGGAGGVLTTQVWPKSRMLFAVVSKMSKEGLLNSQQRGVLKDLILDYDSRLFQFLQEYENGGDRERLYYNFLQIANGCLK